MEGHREGVRNKIYTTRTGGRVLGVRQDTLKHYALKYDHVGVQPGGPGTPWMFTLDDLKEIRRLRSIERAPRESVEMAEDRDELELGPMYDKDLKPIKEDL